MKRAFALLFALLVGLALVVAPVPARADLIAPEEWGEDVVDDEFDEDVVDDVEDPGDIGAGVSKASYLPVAVGVAVVAVGATAGVVLLRRRSA